MATKPNETYRWGENATREQVAAYEDTGWPSDVIPPKRTQFNWYQNLVGKWLGWAEDAVDEIVDTVVDRWFTVVYRSVAGEDWRHAIPNENGLYEFRQGIASLSLDRWFVAVTNGTALAFRLRTASSTPPSHLSIEFGVWDSGLNEWDRAYTFTRSNTRSSILQESTANYVTPKGLVDYFRVPDGPIGSPFAVPHQSGVYFIKAEGIRAGVSIVVGDHQAHIDFDNSASIGYIWNGSAWVQQ